MSMRKLGSFKGSKGWSVFFWGGGGQVKQLPRDSLPYILGRGWIFNLTEKVNGGLNYT